MNDITLKYIDFNEFKEDVYTYYLDIFPEEERKSISVIKRSYEGGYTKIIKIMSKYLFVGFMIINNVKENGYEVLDYFAILPQYREKKIGTEALNVLLEQEKLNKGVFIEVEKEGLGRDDEENMIRQKRTKFYENIGFKKLNFDLSLFNVIYTPYLFSNINEDDVVVINEVFNIYETICGKERIRKNCNVIKVK